MSGLVTDPAADASRDRNPAFNYAQEARDIDSLEQILSNADATYMQALVVRERILGPQCWHRLVALERRSAHYENLRSYRRATGLLKYALVTGGDLKPCCMFFINKLTEIYCRVFDVRGSAKMSLR